MSAAPLIALRRKIVARLKADMIVTALLPAAQIYGERSNADGPWPFSRIGELEGEPGHIITGAIHVFSKSDFTDEVGGITEAIGSSLDNAAIELDDGRRAIVILKRTRTLPDPAEQSAWHGIAFFEATISRDCGEP